jgi:hypothetical protein
VSVVVINYNGSEYLNACLSSLLATHYRRLEIVLIDNGSTDDSFELAKRTFSNGRIRFVPLDENVGYAKACNIGSGLATGEILAFLNNDVVVSPDWLAPLVSTIIADHTVGAVQPKLLLKEQPDLLDAAGGFIDVYGNPRERRGPASSYQVRDEIFYAKGAAILVPRHLFMRLGGFDEDFFLYYEETDLCWRIWLSGRRVMFLPESQVLHVRAATTRAFDQESRTKAYLSARLNRWTMLLKNYQCSNIARILPVILMNQVKDIVVLLVLGTSSSAIVGTVLLPLTLLRQFRRLWRKRLLAQRLRCLPDSALRGRVILGAKPLFFPHELTGLSYRRQVRGEP